MAQATDYVIANQSGANFRSELNSVLAAIVSQNSGSTAPSTTYAYQWWIDTGVTPALLKVRNAANNAWITVGDVTATNLGLLSTATAASTYAPIASPTFTGTVTIPAGASISGYLTTATAGSTYLPLAGGALTGDLTLNGQGDLRFADLDSSNWVALQAPASITTNFTLTLPSADGTNGQALTTSGTGTLSWSTFAPLASPTFTGTVTIPAGASISGYLTTTTAASTYAPLASPTLTGTPAAPTAAVDTNTTQLATTAYVVGQGYLKSATASSTYAPLASPALTGTPTAPTASAGTNTTQIATTAFVLANALSSASPTFTGAIYANGSYRGNVTAMAALDIDCSAGNYFTKTISSNATLTFSNVPASRAYAFTLELNHTSGTITWPASVIWPSGTAPTLTTGKRHLFLLATSDSGTTFRASSLINYAS